LVSGAFEDYVALADEQRMERDETRYFQEYDALRRRGIDAVDKDALAVIERMSGGERLWYRSALAWRRASSERSAAAMISLVMHKPDRLVPTYRQFVGR
jgi:hypothetical protein